jgi:hypothetical protein
MYRNVLLSSIIAGLTMMSPQVHAVAVDNRHVEVVAERRASRNKTRQLATGQQRYPRSRKTRTAAQLKRAAVRRRNIAKRGAK